MQSPSKKNQKKERMLACPFYKKDPLRHWKCIGFASRKISYVKQHIYRSHEQPPYCPSCGTTFDNPDARDVHILAGCIRQPFTPLDGYTLQQRNALGQRVSSSLSLEDQWYAVFDIVCPGYPRPNSPYHDLEVSEALFSDLRLFFTSDAVAASILDNLRRSNRLHQVIDPPLRDALSQELGDLVDRWAVRRSGRTAHSVEGDILERLPNLESLNPSESIEVQPFSNARDLPDFASTTAISSIENDSVGVSSLSQVSMPLYASQASAIAPDILPDWPNFTDFDAPVHFPPTPESRSNITDQGSATISSDDSDWLAELEDMGWANTRSYGF